MIAELNEGDAFERVAAAHGVSRTQAIRVFDEAYPKAGRKPLPKILLIDEFRFSAPHSKYLCHLVDFDRSEAVGLIRSRQKAYLGECFGRIGEKERARVEVFGHRRVRRIRAFGEEVAAERQGPRGSVPHRQAAHGGGRQDRGRGDAPERQRHLGLQLHETEMEAAPDEAGRRPGRALHEEIRRRDAALRRINQALPFPRQRLGQRLWLPSGPMQIHEGGGHVHQMPGERQIRRREAGKLRMQSAVKSRGDVQEMGGGDRQGAGEERVRDRAEQREDGSRERRCPNHDRRRVWVS